MTKRPLFAAFARLRAGARAVELASRPVPPDLAAALERRWSELPDHVRTPAQAIGRRTAGCEGTHGVFPRCDLACTPCYHSQEANRVRVDGEHTVDQVQAQMALLRSERGPGQNAQLIGGEVTLLSPDAHARALEAMLRNDRKPMSLSHGDFDYDYLRELAIEPDGRARFGHLSFAGHFDSMMFGRRGIRRVRDETELDPYRLRFCEMFKRLEREHGVTHYLAHNMTVTPGNIGGVAAVVRNCHDHGFRMFSFQPAAFIGNKSRWKEDYRQFSDEAGWEQIEAGAGCRLPYEVFQIGDLRCNRTVYGAYVGDRYIPFLDDRDRRDLKARDACYEVFGGMDFAVPRALLALRLTRAIGSHPGVLPLAFSWARRFARRAGGLRALRRGGVRAVTFVMHSFMDARQVRPAWELMLENVTAEDPEIRATHERLRACSYAMAHPETGELIPACVQHSVLDPAENLKLVELLPLEANRRKTMT